MDLRDLRFGVEIETVGRTRETVADAIRSVTGGEVHHVGTPQCHDPWEVTAPDGRAWKVVADSSLSAVPPSLRAELVTPILGYNDLPLLQEIVRAIRRAGSASDRNCAIHVHIDSSAFSAAQLCNLAKLVFKQEPLLIRALGIQDSRLQRYTRPISPEFIRTIERSRPKTREALNRAWYGFLNQNPDRYHGSRYSILNLNSVFYRGTIEVRAFEGTLHAGKVKAWSQFSLALAARGLSTRSAASRKREFDPASAKYDFRVFLARIGLVGDEFKTARKHLLGLMPGDAAFKRGRPPKPSNPKTPIPELAAGGQAGCPPSVSAPQEEPCSDLPSESGR